MEGDFHYSPISSVGIFGSLHKHTPHISQPTRLWLCIATMCWLAMKIKQNILFIFFSQLLCVVIASPMKLRARIFTRFNGKSVCVYSFKLCLCFLWANWCERHSMYDYGDWTYWTNSATYWIVCAIGHRLCGENRVKKTDNYGRQKWRKSVKQPDLWTSCMRHAPGLRFALSSEMQANEYQRKS